VNIYIDESGPFIALDDARNSISCVAALVVQEDAHTSLLNRFAKTKTKLGLAPSEEKGSRFDEGQVSALISMLMRLPVFLCVSAIDIGAHTADDVEQHHQAFVKSFTNRLSPAHNPALVQAIEEIASNARRLPPQLFTQAIVLSNLVDNVIRISTLHFAQTSPRDLAKFHWVIDAKADQLTDYEKTWSFAVKPTLQSNSLREPHVFLEGADYSWFAPFELPDSENPPEHLAPFVRNPTGPFASFDVKKIIDDSLQFLDSRQVPGLQIVDVLANAFRRACNGNLKRRGWRNIGRLMFPNPRNGRVIELVALSTEAAKRCPLGDVSYATVLAEIARKAKKLV
jgi:hypothetical protein